jgi:hypothetical protein
VAVKNSGSKDRIAPGIPPGILVCDLHVLQNRQFIKEPDILKGSADPKPVNLMAAQTGDFRAVKKDPSLLWLVKTGENIKNRCLAGSVRAD